MRKRPCSECRRWFQADPRAGSRQKTCGASECKKARHRRLDRAWHERHPDYDRSRRWQKKLICAEAVRKKAPVVSEQALRGVPWDMVETELGRRPAVIAAQLAAVVLRQGQDEMAMQALVLKEEFRRHAQERPQEEIGLQPHEIAGEFRRHAQERSQEEIQKRQGSP